MANKIVYKVLDGEIEYDTTVGEYGKVKKELEQLNDMLAQAVEKFYNDNKDTIMDMYLEEKRYYDYIFRQYAAIMECIKDYMKKYVVIFVNHGVYDIEVDYFISDNDGLKKLFEITEIEYNLKNLMWRQKNNMYDAQVTDAHYNAFSQVQGNQYGIITNSTASLFLYGLENEYRLKKSTAKAEKEYSTSLNQIADSTERWFQNEYMEEFIKYSKMVLSSFPMIIDSIFQLIMDKCIQSGIMNSHIREWINEEKSNMILKNLEIASNKKAVLLDALKTNPFNKEVYSKINSENYLDDNVIKFAIDFGMADCVQEVIISSINYMEANRNIELYKFSEMIRKLTLINGEDQEENKKQVLYKYLDIIQKDLKRVKAQSDNEVIAGQLYSYLSNESGDNDKKLNAYFKKLLAYYGVDNLILIIDSEDMKTFVKENIDYDGEVRKLPEYFTSLYINNFNNYEQKIKIQEQRLHTIEVRNKEIGLEISDCLKVINENKHKLWGDGAKQRKNAEEMLERLNVERERMKQEISDIKNQKEKDKKMSDENPFTIIKIDIDDNNFFFDTVTNINRQISAGFITEETGSELRKKMFDDYTKHKMGGSLEEIKTQLGL